MITGGQRASSGLLVLRGRGPFWVPFIAQSTLGTAGFKDTGVQFCHRLGEDRSGIQTTVDLPFGWSTGPGG